MIDIQSFNRSLKMKWVRGYLNDDNNGKWQLFLDFYLQRCGGKLVFLSNLKPQNVPQLNLTTTAIYWYSHIQMVLPKIITNTALITLKINKMTCFSYIECFLYKVAQFLTYKRISIIEQEYCFFSIVKKIKRRVFKYNVTCYLLSNSFITITMK